MSRRFGGRGKAVTIGTLLLVGLGATAAAAQTVAITNATVYPVSGPKLVGATVLIRDGRIAAVGTSLSVPSNATTNVAPSLRTHGWVATKSSSCAGD